MTSQSEDDGGPPWQTDTISGGYSGRIALMREQCDDVSSGQRYMYYPTCNALDASAGTTMSMYVCV